MFDSNRRGNEAFEWNRRARNRFESNSRFEMGFESNGWSWGWFESNLWGRRPNVGSAAVEWKRGVIAVSTRNGGGRTPPPLRFEWNRDREGVGGPPHRRCIYMEGFISLA